MVYYDLCMRMLQKWMLLLIYIDLQAVVTQGQLSIPLCP